MYRTPFLIALLSAFLSIAPSHADPTPSNAQQVIHLLDYMAVEYPEFVQNGQILNADEYAEQVEFSHTVAQAVGSFPDNRARSDLLQQARQLNAMIESRAAGREVVAQARALQRNLISAYGIRITPARAPDLDRGQQLYNTACIGCHGLAGDGSGPQSRGLEPAPTDFTARDRQMQRSVLGLFNTISLGVDGTSMVPYSHLSADDRWALAFYVSLFSASDAERALGAERWRAASNAIRPTQSLEQLVSATPEEALAQGKASYAVLAYLRSNPQSLSSADLSDPIVTTIAKLRDSQRHYGAGDPDAAYQAAIDAYLDGFELAEARLPSSTRVRLEQEMAAFRSLLKSDPGVETVHDAAEALIRALEPLVATEKADASPATNFAASLIIILREGLEAMLVIVAIAAFLVRSGRRDALVYVHAGWVGALIMGVATWFVSTAIIQITGAQREVTEGVTALLSAALLLYAGYWLHDRSHSVRWQSFIRSQVSDTMTSGQLWGLALVSFLAVYREVFETVLFMQALWVQADGPAQGALIGGSLAGAALLLAAAWVISRMSMKLPLGLFFGASAAFLALLAVIFAGRGVAALQAAGKLALDPVDFFEGIPALGLYPNIQALTLQALMVITIVACILYTRAPTRRQQQ